MLFNSLEFWVFFAVVATVNYSVPARWSRIVLVASSFAFYGMWNPMLLLLLGSCVLFNYATAIAIGRLEGRQALIVLTFAVTANLCLLGFFKYYGFAVGIITNLFHLPGHTFLLDIVLPVAISFYTFEAISYNVDVYRRHLTARTNLIDFALFISFFPHLVAGPIIRPAHFFPQVGGRPIPSGEAIAWGATQIVKGLIKKTVFADNFAVIANGYFDGPVGHAGPLIAWTSTIAFSMQIYFDFSGYTDIARGCARLLGYEFPPNFERPYLSRDIAEFWRRWHISLSTWLRDYLYISLGGNRRGAVRIYVNLLVTMGLGGLWHGANWNFLLWGLYHGGLLVLHRGWRKWTTSLNLEPSTIKTLLSIMLTFTLVTLGWVAFRTTDFATTMRVLCDLAGVASTIPARLPSTFLMLAGASGVWLILDHDRRLQTWLSHGNGMLATVRISISLAIALLILELFSRTDISVPFIYFQF